MLVLIILKDFLFLVRFRFRFFNDLRKITTASCPDHFEISETFLKHFQRCSED